jgi:hypothetical protein
LNQDLSRRWQLLAITAVIGYLIWLLGPVLMPFAIAAMLGYLGDPLADRLERWGLSRNWAATLVFLVLLFAFGGVLLLLVPLVSRQVESVIQNLPHYAEWAQNTAWPWLQTHLHLDPHALDSDRLLALVQTHLGSMGDVAGVLLGKVTSSGVGIVLWLTNLVLVPVVAFYLLRDWDRLVTTIDRMLPRSIQPTIAHLARESDAILGAFVRCLLLVKLALDDLDAIAGNAEAEHALFDLYNRSRAEGSALLFAAANTPNHLGIALPDLRSRLGACTQFALKPLDDAERRHVLTSQAVARGIQLDDSVLDWLFARYARDLGALLDLLDRLDQASLAAQRRITIPFLRDVLREAGPPKPSPRG